MTETTGNILQRKARLTIRVSRNTLTFSAINKDNADTIDYDPYTVRSGISMAANLREAFKQMDLSGRWQAAQVMVDAPAVVVPVSVFNADEADELYRHAMTDSQGKAVLSTVLPALNAVVLYAVSKDLKTVVDDHFSDVRYSHVCVPVWNHLYRRSFTGVRQKLYIYFHDKRMEVFAFQQSRFRFVNSFDTAVAADAVYFALHVWKQLAMDSRRDELHLIGDLPSREQLTTELKQFIQNVYVVNPKAEFNRSPITEIKNLPYDLITHYVKMREV